MTSSDDLPTPEDSLPDAVIRRLQNADRVPFEVPTDQHEQILQQARGELMPVSVRTPGRRWLRISAVVSSVCAALLLFGVIRFIRPANPIVNSEMAGTTVESVRGRRQLNFGTDAPALSAMNPKDIDENGTVDILDAYALARRLENGDSSGPWDFNRDGQLNEDDVRLVALDAVML